MGLTRFFQIWNSANSQYMLFKDVAVKFRKGTSETVYNMILSIEKMPEHINKTLCVRSNNKRCYFSGTILKGIT